jgi:hypothetical protein
MQSQSQRNVPDILTSRSLGSLVCINRDVNQSWSVSVINSREATGLLVNRMTARLLSVNRKPSEPCLQSSQKDGHRHKTAYQHIRRGTSGRLTALWSIGRATTRPQRLCKRQCRDENLQPRWTDEERQSRELTILKTRWVMADKKCMRLLQDGVSSTREQYSTCKRFCCACACHT